MKNTKVANINKYCVYSHSKPNGEVFYIGIGNEKRPYIKSNRNNYWKNIVKKYNNYIIRIIKTNLPKEEACELEEMLINEYGRKDLNEGTLVNFTNGGEGVNGIIFTKERNEKISKALKGRKLSEKQKQRLLKVVTNPSKETRLKMRNAKLGTKQNKETINKRKEYNKGNCKLSKKIICTKTNKIWNCIQDAAEEYGIKYGTLKCYLCNSLPNKTTLKYYEKS